MTLRQEAHSMIDALPTDESLRYVIGVIREFSQFLDTNPPVCQPTDTSEKRRAFLRMEELRRTHPIPDDYDLEQARREAVEAKYGRFSRFGLSQ